MKRKGRKQTALGTSGLEEQHNSDFFFFFFLLYIPDGVLLQHPTWNQQAQTKSAKKNLSPLAKALGNGGLKPENLTGNTCCTTDNY